MQLQLRMSRSWPSFQQPQKAVEAPSPAQNESKQSVMKLVRSPQEIPLVSLLTDAELVDAAAGEHRSRVEQRDVVRHQAPARAERCHLEQVSRCIVGRHENLSTTRSRRRRECAAVQSGDVVRHRSPAHPVGNERRRQPLTHVVESVAGRLNATPAQVSLAWIASRPGMTGPIASATTPEQLRDIVGGIDLKLDNVALATLDRASAWASAW